MPTLAITIQTPAAGVRGQSGNGPTATTEKPSEANTADENLVNVLVPFLKSLPDRPPRRSGNVTGFDLLGPSMAGNTYLLLLSVDAAQGAVDGDELLKLLPAGSQASARGQFELLDSVWHPQRREPRFTAAFTIQTPPVGELETRADGSDPTAEQMSEEKTGRDNVVKVLVPFLQSLPNRPPRPQQPPFTGRISGFDLFGIDQWSKLNNYLLLLTADDGHVDLGEEKLVNVLPAGSQVSALGNLETLAQQPAPFAFGPDTQPRGGFD